MASSKSLHRLATNPADYVRFLSTGRLPRGARPQGPLVELLAALSPRDLVRIRGVTVGPSLGYSGSRRFATAAQARQWVAPDDEVFGAFPADSWRDKRFVRPLHLEDLAECCAEFPEALLAAYPRLRRPTLPGRSGAGPA